MGQVSCRLLVALVLPVLALAGAAGCQATTELDRGDELLAEGRNAEAVAVWRQALAQTPRDTGLLTRIATAQVRMRRFDAAEATMLQAVAIEPESPKVRQNLALVYLRRKDLDRALKTFHEVRGLEDTYPETNYYIGLIHEMRGDEATAVDYYIQDVNNGPSKAWERLDRHKDRQRAAGLVRPAPSSRNVLVFSLACLALAAAAFALRQLLVGRREAPPFDTES
ncbi:MAG TPA: tetratricopeptide repeat protein [Planctomycetota bacterium]|nr:tetratricopeptide repeat protein [Planctomycetota bacterium]